MSNNSSKDVPETYPAPAHGWTCFHCGETFTGQQAARLHFGASINDEPKCQISAHRVRAMEADLARYRDEDTDLHREIARMQTDHTIALRREEEKGYARGLEDAKKHPETLGLRCADETYAPLSERPAAWIKGHVMHTDSGMEYDEEVVPGSDCPPGKGWTPLYPKARHTCDTSSECVVCDSTAQKTSVPTEEKSNG